MKRINVKQMESDILKKISSVWIGVGDNKDGNRHEIVTAIWNRVNWFLSLVQQKYNLKNIKTILDVGSLNGIESVFFSKLLPWAEIHSFDVSPIAIEMIKDNQKGIQNCHFHQIAISNIIGKVSFWIPKDNWGAASILKPINGPGCIENPTVCSVIEVPCITIESWAKEQNINSIELLWMDLQGNELNALKGMGNLIDNVIALHSEIGLKPYYEGHQLYPEINYFLEMRGFVKNNSIYPLKHDEEGGFEKDMVYIRK